MGVMYIATALTFCNCTTIFGINTRRHKFFYHMQPATKQDHSEDIWKDTKQCGYRIAPRSNAQRLPRLDYKILENISGVTLHPIQAKPSKIPEHTSPNILGRHQTLNYHSALNIQPNSCHKLCKPPCRQRYHAIFLVCSNLWKYPTNSARNSFTKAKRR